MKLSVIRIIYDVLLWQTACSLAITSAFLVFSLEDNYQDLSPSSVISMCFFTFIQWIMVLMFLFTADLLILPPIFAVLHLTCGLPYYK